MPTTTQSPIEAYAHCRNPRCQGSQQEKVAGVLIEDSYTFVERGGDLPGFENSSQRVTFADAETSPCGHCGKDRDITDTPRPSYEALSGFSQDGLLDIEVNPNGLRFDPAKQAEIQAESDAELKAENQELRERLAKLEGFMLGQAPKAEPEGE